MFSNNMEKVKEEALEILQKADDKASAIVEVMDKIMTAKNESLINELVSQQESLNSNSNLNAKLGLRVLSNEEKQFYEKLKDVKQSITASQIDIIPTSLVDVPLENVKETSTLITSGLIEFAPVGVKKWLSSEKSGTFAWGKLDAALTAELSATISAINLDINKLTAYLIIPKAIRELSYEIIDKYFLAILEETIHDGIEHGYLNGNGVGAPIGIYNKTNTVESNGTHAAKTVLSTITNFSPKGLATVKKTLSNSGKRTYDKIFLICNPADEADYVAPALFDREGNNVSSYKNLEVITSTQNTQGKAIFTIPKKYTMGISSVTINEYDQTKALDDADLVIAKVYANGKAVDDSVAVPFDVTKLEEYIPVYKEVNSTPATQNTNSSETPGA
mgnify:CR=1 FL=1